MQAKHKDRTQRTQTQDARQPRAAEAAPDPEQPADPQQPLKIPTHVYPPAAGPQPRSGGIFAIHTKFTNSILTAGANIIQFAYKTGGRGPDP